MRTGTIRARSETFVLAALVLAGGACVSGRVTTGGPAIAEVQNQSAVGLKARVAVARFENKVEGNLGMSFQRQIAQIMMQAQAAMAQAMKELNKQQGGTGTQQPAWVNSWANSGDPISSGIKDMLTNELVSSNKFLVYERENLADIMAEQQLSSSGAAKTKIPENQLEGVELFIYGALTEFDATGQGGEVTIPIPALGHTFDTTIGYTKAAAAMDLRIVDTRTGRIVGVTTVKGSATGVHLGSQDNAQWGSLPTTLEGYKNTPVEAALRKMIKEAVKAIVSKTPKEYYHYSK
jgi:curli biogenesis system outer membrane secretion channel CsgG